MEDLRELLDKLTDEEKDYLYCQQSNGKQIKVIDGKVVAVKREATEQEKAQIRIGELKNNLFETDYQVLKWKEGELTDYEFEPMRLQRKAWREEIRELEKLI